MSVPTITDIQIAVCERFGMRHIEMQSTRRQRVLSRPRHIAMYLSRELTPRSLPEIGRMFGNRDHTTVLHACRQIRKLAEQDRELAATVDALRTALTDAPAVDPNQMLLPLAAK